MKQVNEEIRRAARVANVPLWVLAREFGVTDSHFSRRLRTEFSTVDQQKALLIIDRLREELD